VTKIDSGNSKRQHTFSVYKETRLFSRWCLRPSNALHFQKPIQFETHFLQVNATSNQDL